MQLTRTILPPVPADLSHHPRHLPAFIEAQQRSDADVVAGTRYSHGGGVAGWGLGRRLTSRGANLLASFLLGASAASDLTGAHGSLAIHGTAMAIHGYPGYPWNTSKARGHASTGARGALCTCCAHARPVDTARPGRPVLTARHAGYTCPDSEGRAGCAHGHAGAYRLYRREALEALLPAVHSKGYAFQVRVPSQPPAARRTSTSNHHTHSSALRAQPLPLPQVQP